MFPVIAFGLIEMSTRDGMYSAENLKSGILQKKLIASKRELCTEMFLF